MMVFFCARCGSAEVTCQECGRVACVSPECSRFIAMDDVEDRGYVCAAHRVLWRPADLSPHYTGGSGR